MIGCYGLDPGSGVLQGSHRDWKTWKMKTVMEKSWNMKNWPKVMESCDRSGNFTNFAPELYQICMFLATTKKLSIDVEIRIFQCFSSERRECKINGKLRNGHGKVIEKYFVKSVGTLEAGR